MAIKEQQISRYKDDVRETRERFAQIDAEIAVRKYIFSFELAGAYKQTNILYYYATTNMERSIIDLLTDIILCR